MKSIQSGMTERDEAVRLLAERLASVNLKSLTVAAPLAKLKHFFVEIRPSGVYVLWLLTQRKSVSTIGSAVLEELDLLLETLNMIRPRGLIFASECPIGGADIGEIHRLQQNRPPKEMFEATSEGKRILMKLQGFKSAAVITGSWKGGGFEAALWCRYRIAAKTTGTDLDAEVSLPEPFLGVIAGFGGNVRVMEIMDPLAGVKFLAGGKSLDAEEAWHGRLIDELVDADNVGHLIAAAEQTVLGKRRRGGCRCSATSRSRSLQEKFASGLLSLRARGDGKLAQFGRSLLAGPHRKVAKGVLAEVKKKSRGYPSFAAAAEVALKSLDLPRSKALLLESVKFSELAHSNAGKNGVRNFIYRSDLRFRARNNLKKLLKGVEPSINVVGVVGAGFMGREIAFELACSKAIERVVLIDKDDGGLSKAWLEINKLFIERGLSDDKRSACRQKIVKGTDYDLLAECDVVIEAVFENLEVKRLCFEAIDAAMAKRTKTSAWYLMSNTSALKLDELARFVRNKQNFVGLHFFSPVSKMLGVEVVSAPQTSKEAAAVASYVVCAIDKLAFPCFSRSGFIVNDILGAQLTMASWLLELGVSPGAIDKAMINLGFPMGPFHLMDHVALKIALDTAYSLAEAFGERFALPPDSALVKLEEAGHQGHKTGQGIYVWDGDKLLIDKKTRSPVVNPDLLALRPDLGKTVLAERTIQELLLGAMLNEAARVFESGIVEEPWIIDSALIFCAGFPFPTGGPIRRIDQLGVRVFRDLSLDIASGGNEPWRKLFEPCALLNEHANKGTNFHGD